LNNISHRENDTVFVCAKNIKSHIKKNMILLTFLLICGDLSVPAQIASVANYESMALYYKPSCPHSQRVLAYMKSHNISIPLKNVAANPQAKKELEILGGHMIVPCLIVDGTPIYDDTDIIDWLKNNSSNLQKN
jgi:glutaredoxin